MNQASTERFVSICCQGERCRVCREPAEHKVGEVIFDDDPQPIRHEFTAYLCDRCFNMVMGLPNAVLLS